MARTTRTELRLRREARRRNRRRLGVAATTGLLLLSTVAFADDINNDLDAGVNTIELEVGDTSAPISVWVDATGTPEPDVPGCNIGGQHQLVLDVASSDATKASVSPAQLTIGDCGDSHGQVVTVTGHVPTGGTGVLITFTINEEQSSFRTHESGPPQDRVIVESQFTNNANFTVNVLEPVVEAPTRDAPAIANEYLRDREDNADCLEKQGTNKNKNNWHGQLISKIAKHFEGQSFTAAQEEEVHDAVETLCAGGTL